MVSEGNTNCPKCGGKLKYYDHVARVVKERYGRRKHLFLSRYKCCECHSVHRALPEEILPYKHYTSDVIFGVINGLITYDTLGFEDYPCEWTMQWWISHEATQRFGSKR